MWRGGTAVIRVDKEDSVSVYMAATITARTVLAVRSIFHAE